MHLSSLTAETEETISGSIPDLADAHEEYFIQIQSDSGHYTSARVPLRHGKFFDTLSLVPNRTNVYRLYLFDKTGNPVQISPNSFSITHGLSVSGPPIPHSIGVAVAKKDFRKGGLLTEIFEPFFEKGNSFPLVSEPPEIPVR